MLCICKVVHSIERFVSVDLGAAHYNTLQHTAAHCNALQRTATHCNALQRTATQGSTLYRALCFRRSLAAGVTVSTEIATPPKSTKSRNSRFLGISQYKFQLRFWLGAKRPRGLRPAAPRAIRAGFNACEKKIQGCICPGVYLSIPRFERI